MSMFDDVRGKAENMMNDLSPEQKQKIEEIAQKHGLSPEEARDRFFKTQGNDSGQDHPDTQSQQQGQQHDQQDMGQSHDMDTGDMM